MKITSALKGFIAAIIMIGICLYAYAYAPDSNPATIRYAVYSVYIIAIVWSVVTARMNGISAFGELFSNGFRCFIIVTLCMALFYGIFNAAHPEFASESAEEYRKTLSPKEKTPDEIEKEVATYKKQYNLRQVSVAIFGYLIIGAGATALVSFISTRRT